MKPRLLASSFSSLASLRVILTFLFAAGLVRSAKAFAPSPIISGKINRRLYHYRQQQPRIVVPGPRRTMATSASLKPYLETLIAGERSLTFEETKAAFSEILQGCDEVQVGSLLTLLRARGETPSEIAGMVQAMNEACKQVDLGDRKLLDIVGTGGDGADTINISTASVVLAAACGCTVSKAGNRSVSSRCGSADVLEALGVKVDLQPDQVVECVKECGVAFMFAPVNHPSMKFVAPVRQKLGVRTCFNILGPMTNAAGAQHAVIGVFQPHLMELMAGALQEVGKVDHAVIIHGVGLDEISPLGPATILEVRGGLCVVIIVVVATVVSACLLAARSNELGALSCAARYGRSGKQSSITDCPLRYAPSLSDISSLRLLSNFMVV